MQKLKYRGLIKNLLTLPQTNRKIRRPMTNKFTQTKKKKSFTLNMMDIYEIYVCAWGRGALSAFDIHTLLSFVADTKTKKRKEKKVTSA